MTTLSIYCDPATQGVISAFADASSAPLHILVFPTALYFEIELAHGGTMNVVRVRIADHVVIETLLQQIAVAAKRALPSLSAVRVDWATFFAPQLRWEVTGNRPKRMTWTRPFSDDLHFQRAGEPEIWQIIYKESNRPPFIVRDLNAGRMLSSAWQPIVIEDTQKKDAR